MNWVAGRRGVQCLGGRSVHMACVTVRALWVCARYVTLPCVYTACTCGRYVHEDMCIQRHVYTVHVCCLLVLWYTQNHMNVLCDMCKYTPKHMCMTHIYVWHMLLCADIHVSVCDGCRYVHVSGPIPRENPSCTEPWFSRPPQGHCVWQGCHSGTS